ncbi:MAG TPA: helix-hairpin-helix domain-containing protein [Hanamia sp.]|nr:helix-hairpin-helix domain-containing protein [Hanamia sp.]
MWQQFLKDYFNFTKKERRGIIFIICIILVIIIPPLFFPYFNKGKTDTTQFEKEIAQLRVDSSAKKYYSKNDDEYYNDYTPSEKKYETKTKAEVFFFDPNSASVADWIRLGIREKTANTIQKYISKGGKFYKPEDIKKIWGLSPKDAERLMPYVSIKEVKKEYPQYEQKEYSDKKNYSTKNTVLKIDINLSDTSQYIALPGIGSKLSKRIIAFREKLGGFYSIDQIGETYLLPDSTFQKIKQYLVLNSKAIKKININSASVEEMKSHPYIRYNMANAIFQYRQQHGSFNSVAEIKKIMMVTDDFYNKASPYLTIE